MARNSPLNILIAYENLAAGIRAQVISNKLAAQLKPDCDVNTDVWKFDVLHHPQLRNEAARQASAADLIIIATHTVEELPSYVGSWMDMWVMNKKNGPVALVALLGGDRMNSWSAQKMRDQLQRIAEEGGLDFFCKTASHGSEEGFLPEALRHEDDGMPVYSQGATDSGWRGWGIND